MNFESMTSPTTHSLQKFYLKQGSFMGFLFLKSLWSFKLGSTVMAKMAVCLQSVLSNFFFFLSGTWHRHGCDALNTTDNKIKKEKKKICVYFPTTITIVDQQNKGFKQISLFLTHTQFSLFLSLHCAVDHLCFVNVRSATQYCHWSLLASDQRPF